MNRFDYISNYNYYGRGPKELLKEDEIDDILGLNPAGAEGDGGEEKEGAEGEEKQDSLAPDANADGMPPVEVKPDDNTVQVDVTGLVLKQDEINKTVQDLLSKIDTLITNNDSLKKDLGDRIENLETKTKETISKVNSELEKRVPTPIEQLQMRSLSSFPYNVKLTDYWVPSQEDKNKYAIANAGLNNNENSSENAEQKDQEYVLKQSDVMKDYNENTVRKSF
jgi:hypothetical protein